MYTEEEYKAYRKVQRLFMLEDARSQSVWWFSNNRECLTDDDIERIEEDFYGFFDYEKLVDSYFHWHDCNVSENDMWQEIIEQYVEDKLAEEAK